MGAHDGTMERSYFLSSGKGGLWPFHLRSIMMEQWNTTGFARCRCDQQRVLALRQR